MTGLATELLVVVALAATGLLLLPRTGWSAGWQLAAALPVGLAALTVLELALLASGLPIARPRVALVVAFVLAVAAAAARRGGGWPPARMLLGGAVVLVAVTALAVWLPLVNVTADSFRYLLTSGLLADTGDPGSLSAFQLQKRSLAVGLVHGLAPEDPGYLRAVGPLVGIGTVALLHLAVAKHLRRLGPRTAGVIALAAAVLLASNHRFVFSSFYLNGHGFFAAWLLLLAVVVLTVRRDPQWAGGRVALVAALTASAIALVRPEGALVATLALTPLAVDHRLPVRWRRLVLVPFGLAVVAWHVGVVGMRLFDAGESMGLSLLGMTALGAGVVVVALALPLVDRVGVPHPLLWLHGLAWLAAVLLTLRAPNILRTSAIATMRNVTSDGVWGVSLLLLTILLVVGVVLRRVEAEDALLFPLATFVPLALLLAFLRGDGGGPYRIGPGDSLNRMLVHLVPTAILLLALLADSLPRERPWRSAGRRTTGRD